MESRVLTHSLAARGYDKGREGGGGSSAAAATAAAAAVSMGIKQGGQPMPTYLLGVWEASWLVGVVASDKVGGSGASPAGTSRACTLGETLEWPGSAALKEMEAEMLGFLEKNS